MGQLRHYYIHCPGMIYACDEYGTNRADAINKFKAKNGMTRMPTGYACWTA